MQNYNNNSAAKLMAPESPEPFETEQVYDVQEESIQTARESVYEQKEKKER